MMFDFGSNWQAFSESGLTLQQLDEAQRSIRSLLDKEHIQGCTFLDVGCGSGIFSIAAWQLGATCVTGIDINPTCILVSQKNRDRLAANAEIKFEKISALDREKLSTLDAFDIVYAWGSLHHTGNLWRAIDLISEKVYPNGLFIISIYNKHLTSPIWKFTKWLYNRLPRSLQAVMVRFFAVIIYLAKLIVTRDNPLKKERGMDFWYDVVDWVGGYPYQYAASDEVIKYFTDRGFVLLNLIKAQVPTGCNEFVFRKIS